MTNWRNETLGEVCELKRGYDLPRGSRRPGSVPVISSSGPTGWHDDAKVKAPGVVTGRYGTLGEVFYVAEDFWPLNTALYVRDFKGNDPQFVAVLLRSLNLAQYDGAAAVPGLNRNHLHTLPVRIPELSVQVAISQISGAFENLIENNHRRVGLLEEMARAIYREWFVKFRYPGHEDVPLVDSALGPIPEGWEVKSVGSVARIIRGRSYKSAELVDTGGLPFVNLKCMARGGGFRRDGLKRYSGKYKDDQIISQGDIVLAVTDLTQGREILARATLVPRLTGDLGVISLDVVRLVPLDSADRLWLFAALAWSSFASYVKEFCQWFDGPPSLPKHLEAAPVLWPPAELRKSLVSAIEPALAQIDVLSEQSESLRALRTWVLPKLVSGQIDVSTLDLDDLIGNQVA